MSVEEQLEGLKVRLVRIERLLREVTKEIEPAPKRLTEKNVIQQYGVSQHVLRRLRLGYTRSDGLKIKPMLFKWGHRKGRDFDYDTEELDAVLGRKMI